MLGKAAKSSSKTNWFPQIYSEINLDTSLNDWKGETRFRKRSLHGCQKERSFVMYHNRLSDIWHLGSSIIGKAIKVFQLLLATLSKTRFNDVWRTKLQLIETSGLAPRQKDSFSLFVFSSCYLRKWHFIYTTLFYRKL